MITLDLPDSVLFARACDAERVYRRRARRIPNEPAVRLSSIERRPDGTATITLRAECGIPIEHWTWNGRTMVRTPRAWGFA